MKSAVRNQEVVGNPGSNIEAILHEQLALHRLKRIERRSRWRWLKSAGLVALAALRAVGKLRSQGELVVHSEPGKVPSPLPLAHDRIDLVSILR